MDICSLYGLLSLATWSLSLYWCCWPKRKMQFTLRRRNRNLGPVTISLGLLETEAIVGLWQPQPHSGWHAASVRGSSSGTNESSQALPIYFTCHLLFKGDFEWRLTKALSVRQLVNISLDGLLHLPQYTSEHVRSSDTPPAPDLHSLSSETLRISQKIQLLKIDKQPHSLSLDSVLDFPWTCFDVWAHTPF